MPETSTTAATPTPEPEAWEVRSRAGVEAYLERYVEIFSDAIRSGSTDDLRALSTNCEGCDQVAAQIEEVYGAGGEIRSEPFRYTGSSVDQGGIRDGAACVVTYESSGTTWVRSKGAEPERYPGGTNEKAVKLEWTGSGWTITSLTNLESR